MHDLAASQYYASAIVAQSAGPVTGVALTALHGSGHRYAFPSASSWGKRMQYFLDFPVAQHCPAQHKNFDQMHLCLWWEIIRQA